MRFSRTTTQARISRFVSHGSVSSGSMLVACAAAVLLGQAALVRIVGAKEPSRPNFVFIITDDQAPNTLSCYGNRVCRTPTLDRLAADGIVLDDAHHMGAWVGAVCTASRTMIMTGRTLWHVPGARGPGIEFPKSYRKEAAETCFAEVFNKAGYDTFRTCKRGNSYREANAKFQIVHEASKRAGTPEGGSRWHADRVLDYLKDRQKRHDSDPFFIYFGFSHPHDPRHALPDLGRKYGAHDEGPLDHVDPKSPPLPPNYLPAHPFHHGHPGLRDEVKVQGVMTRRDEATVRNETGRYYACIENIDQQIGRVIAKLKEMGVYDNTYIVFTSDHGIAVGRHGLMGKQNLYEHTWRVPMIVVGPGIKAGSRASGFVYLLDVFPTFCDLAGITLPKTIEGKSFRTVLEGRQNRIRGVVYGCYCGGTKPGIRAIKTPGWKLVVWDVLEGQVQEKQLFDLKTNPNEFLAEHHTEALRKQLGIDPRAEQTDLAENADYAERRQALERLLYREMKRLGDPYADDFSIAH